MQKGQGVIFILVGVLVVVLIASGAFYLGRTTLRQNPSGQAAPNPSPTSQSISTPSATSDETANWKTYTNTKYGYQLQYPKDWSSYIPSWDQETETLDSICLEKDPNKCVLRITVLEGTSWDREQTLLGLTLSSVEDTKDISFAGANGFKRIGYFGENGSLYGFVAILQKNNKVYKIWAHQKTEDKSDYTDVIDQILSTFRFD